MSALNSSVVSAATTDRASLFQWGNSPWGKSIPQVITGDFLYNLVRVNIISLGPAIL